jgi:hypothetical protein
MLPKSLYELIPFLYIFLGIAAALVLYNSYAIISGNPVSHCRPHDLIHSFKKPAKGMERFERLYILTGSGTYVIRAAG